MTLRTWRAPGAALIASLALALACGSSERLAVQGDDAGNEGSGVSPGGATGNYFFNDSTGGANGNAGGASGSGSVVHLDAGSGASSSWVPPDASYPDISFPFDPSRARPDACATVTGEATERQRPMDIIVSIDNSGSMSSEIEEVQARINLDFYDILEASGIDYRVIMVSRYGHVNTSIGGSNNPVHISPPLGGSTCPQSAPNDPCEPLAFPDHGKYYHYSADIESRDMWQKLLGGLFRPDELESDSNVRDGGDQFFPWTVRAATGYAEFLREDSFKVILGISDDSVGGSEFSPSGGATWSFSGSSANAAADALEFDTAVRTLAPEHFGPLPNDADRNYEYYAIAGFESGGYVTVPPDEPVIDTLCENVDGNSGATTGLDHQELSILTGGLRYSSCRTANYDPIFTEIAQAVVEGARVPCEFDFPPPPDGKLIDLEALVVTWENSSGAEPIGRVDTCSGAGYRLDFSQPDAGVSTDPERILLCDASCTAVRADVDSSITVDFGCIGQ